ncbi:hypothetical protein E0765_00045 [Sulfuricurvum sp. IAE1]|uniref:hypothetical protein n=1 Tax=Sulfuricurvum sp. IAE1 TaxID=2546102 RepID=UPI00104C2EE6|nr:hypothetical protein [Sulfuricurvum sp. IAE1]TDA69671.1 hypothetical protein E0765_00045 [Sulfuricurvum sp. IAE1]
MTPEEKEHQRNRYYSMARIQLQETDKKEFKQMVKDKTLGEYLSRKADAMMNELETLMAQGYNQREASEIVVHHHIIEM